jgi:putative FmdB family regulatory protein
MPFYEYECKNCGHALEAMQKINDSPLRKCPHCGKSQLQRLMSAPVFRLKGGGWYETDFKGDQDNKRNLADGPEPEAKDSSKEPVKDAGKDGSATDNQGADGKAADTKVGDGKAADSTPLRLAAAKPGDTPLRLAADKPVDKAAAKPAEKAAAAAGKRPAASRPSKRGAASHPKAHARRAVKKPAAKSKRR